MKNWVSKRQLDIDHICILVFDEADEMLKADAFADDTGGRAQARVTRRSLTDSRPQTVTM